MLAVLNGQCVYFIRWFPNHERATAVGISMGGFQLGNVVGLLITPIAMASIGISGPFILFTSLGILWLITWIFRVSSDPQESKYISKSELRMVQVGKLEPHVIKSKLPPLRLLFSKLPTWAIIFANVINNWVGFLSFSSSLHIQNLNCLSKNYFWQGYFVLLSWMPVYFKTVSTTIGGSNGLL